MVKDVSDLKDSRRNKGTIISRNGIHETSEELGRARSHRWERRFSAHLSGVSLVLQALFDMTHQVADNQVE